eukprot:1589774-Rhodomonas_salina.2
MAWLRPLDSVTRLRLDTGPGYSGSFRSASETPSQAGTQATGHPLAPSMARDCDLRVSQRLTIVSETIMMGPMHGSTAVTR